VYDEVWVVAGGEPGARRLGQLVQGLRKKAALSAEEVASRAGLSVGTVRAIEQGRRAPSAESGIRILDLLLPERSLPPQEGASGDPGDVGYDYSFIDPESGARVVVRFKARTAGDNRRWSSDLPRPGESPVEAAILALMSDPEWQKKFRENVVPALGPVLDRWRLVLADAQARAERPATDEDYGRLVRKLATFNEYRLARIEKLLDWWTEVDTDTATADIRRVVSKVESALDSITILSPEDRGSWMTPTPSPSR
jgi:transcriptional regulator with XRE-family HTH domain